MLSPLRLLVVAAALSLVAAPAPAGAVGDPRLPEQWGLATIGAPAAWSVGTGSGITIAVVDTGADFGHEDLAPKLLPGRNFVDTNATAQDNEGHGSHVAGVAAAATGNGVGVAGTAPGARILPVKVLDEDGSGSVDDISEGIRWAAANGAHVINLSLGPEIPILPSLLGTGLEEAIGYAWGKGSVVVVAAGNTSLFSSPYSDLDAVVVTATTRGDRLAGYASGVGSAKWGISAPGGSGGSNKADDVLSTYWKPGLADQYAFLSGTSMATPHVAGAAAVLRGLGLTPQQTVDRLLSTARDLGRPGRDSTYGAGRLDLAAAVGAMATPPVPPPTAPPVRTAGPGPSPKPDPATTAPRPGPGAAAIQPPAITLPAPVSPAGATSAPEGSAPPAPTQVAAPPGDGTNASAGRPAGDDPRPWLPIGAATVALAGSVTASLLVRRSSRST